MRPEQVAGVMSDPLAQELLRSAIPARIAYLGTDGFPRAVPVGFLWKDGRIFLCTASNAYKARAPAANPRMDLTIDADTQPPRALLVRGTADWSSSTACLPSTWRLPERPWMRRSSSER